MSCLVTLQFTWSGASLSLCKSEIIKFSNTISKVFLLLLLCCCYNHWLNRQLQWTTTEVRHLFCIFRAYLWCHRRIISTRRHLDLEPTPRFASGGRGDTDTGIKSGMTSETMTQAEVRGRVPVRWWHSWDAAITSNLSQDQQNTRLIVITRVLLSSSRAGNKHSRRRSLLCTWAFS